MKIIRSKPQDIRPEMMDILCYWIKERNNVRVLKKNGSPFPWSEDPLITYYRWCNVRRMDDKVSVWLLDWHRSNPRVSFRERIIPAAFGRLINWPETLDELPYPTPYTSDIRDELSDKILLRKARGAKVFTGAYIVNGALKGDKIIQVTDKVLWPLAQSIDELPKRPTTMQEVHEALVGRPGIGSFMAGQIVADLRHIHPELPWEDRHTWAPRGPGSIRGINRLLGRPPGKSIKAGEWLDTLRAAYAQARARLPRIFQRLELMDMQNCMCEFDKYVRLSKNEGTVRSRYEEPSR